MLVLDRGLVNRLPTILDPQYFALNVWIAHSLFSVYTLRMFSFTPELFTKRKHKKQYLHVIYSLCEKIKIAPKLHTVYICCNDHKKS